MFLCPIYLEWPSFTQLNATDLKYLIWLCGSVGMWLRSRNPEAPRNYRFGRRFRYDHIVHKRKDENFSWFQDKGAMGTSSNIGVLNGFLSCICRGPRIEWRIMLPLDEFGRRSRTPRHVSAADVKVSSIHNHFKLNGYLLNNSHVM
jgi:hypothetical protein